MNKVWIIILNKHTKEVIIRQITPRDNYKTYMKNDLNLNIVDVSYVVTNQLILNIET